MLPLHHLLSRFKNLTNTEKVKKECIVEIFVNNKIPVTLSQVSILKRIVFIKVPPTIKTEILLKKEEFLSQIKNIPGFINIEDIR